MKHQPRVLIDDFAASLGLRLDRDDLDRLLRLESLLRTLAVPAGMVSGADAGRLLERHVLDSLRGVVAVEPPDRDAYDLGSGAGLPGLVVAIVRPELRVALVESRRRRVAVLEEMIRELGAENVHAVHGRIEALREPVDVCFARALAPAERAWQLAERLLHPGGRLVYFAGEEIPSPAFPGAPQVRTLRPLLASSGPLVIMTRR